MSRCGTAATGRWPCRKPTEPKQRSAIFAAKITRGEWKQIPAKEFPLLQLRAICAPSHLPMSLSLSQRPRTLSPEILDDLPADHPDARSSRRDLRWFNCALGNWRWFGARSPGLLLPNERVLELGAGTGELAARMTSHGVAWDCLDRVPRPSDLPATSRWHQTDLFCFSGWADYGVIAGNLIFHHFDHDQLRSLGEWIDTHARVLIVGDLKRGRVQQCLFWAFARLIGANHVSLHDGWLSIRAGFRGNELPELLGLSPSRWTWRIERAQPTAYRLIAQRRP